jgi:diguanylate cyclase (GGDEF)-like protein
MAADPGLTDLQRKLEESAALLRRALTEKGEMALAQLEEARVRAYQAAEAARLDTATHCLRHGFLRERLAFEVSRAIENKEPLGLVVFDLDGFGAFNEARGYGEGEQVLGLVGRSLVNPWLRSPGLRPPVFGRDGADTFVVILPATDRDQTLERADELRYLIERLPVGPPRLTATFGVATLRSGDSGPILLRRAFAALTEARSRGRNLIHAGDDQGP